MEKDSNGQLSEDTQATDLELLETGVQTGERGSVHSVITPSSSLEDPEHPPYVQLKAFLIVMGLFSLVWASGALTILTPLKLPCEEKIFSAIYAFLMICLGIFVVFFYCFSRSDVRSVWFTLKPIVRSRNVTDVQTVPPVITSRSSISSSIGLKSVTPRPEPQGEPLQKTNFVDLHRRQYHSQSVMVSEPNAFYNPHQSIVARKFFKKQRRKQNSLGARRSGDGATPISPDTSELFHPKVGNGDIGTPESDLGRPLERLVIGAERNEPALNDSVKYASVASECCSCMVSEAHSATDCTRDITSEHSSRSSHLYATVAPDMSPLRVNKHPRLTLDAKNEAVRIKIAPYNDIKSSDDEKRETCL